MSTCLFGPLLTLGDILVIIAYTQKPRENVDADIHVSSGDRGLNSTAIYHLHSYFTLTSLYYYTDFPESRVLFAGQCDKYQTYVLAKTCKGECSEDILKTYNHPVCPSVCPLKIGFIDSLFEVYCNENRFM